MVSWVLEVRVLFLVAARCALAIETGRSAHMPAQTGSGLVYGLFGGMPLYLSWWGQDRSFAENLIPLALSPGRPAFTEGRLIIDAVLLAEPELTRIPVAVGESKWARSVNGGRQRARLTAKAAALTPDVDRLAYIICARSEVVSPPESDMIAITAADIFPDPR